MKTALWDRTVEEHRETDFTDHEDWCIEGMSVVRWGERLFRE